ncbi:MAG: hypothetical protein CMQ24_10295 [Gammaproteobacteria bacterium]|nr:hypothetical protein [Gammaproteobacteria bacterium]
MADDSPFVTDSVLIALGADGAQTRFFANDVVRREAHPPTAIFYAELDALDTGDLAALEVRLRETLLDVKAVVADFAAMRERLTLARDALADWGFGGEDLEEARAFLEWLARDHFVFLGFREFDYGAGTLRQVDGALGILSRRKGTGER